jgi:putative transposase
MALFPPFLLTNDNYIKSLRPHVWLCGGVPWQRCQFHLHQKCPSLRASQVHASRGREDINTIFNSPNSTAAETYLTRTIEKYYKAASRLAEWLAANIPEELTIFSFPAARRILIRTTNGVERLHREVRRRARVVSIFLNPAFCLRLVSAVLNEISDDWLACKASIIFKVSSFFLKGST